MLLFRRPLCHLHGCFDRARSATTLPVGCLACQLLQDSDYQLSEALMSCGKNALLSHFSISIRLLQNQCLSFHKCQLGSLSGLAKEIRLCSFHLFSFKSFTLIGMPTCTLEMQNDGHASKCLQLKHQQSSNLLE